MLALLSIFGAGNEARTRDLNLGKVALYQLSYSRIVKTSIIHRQSGVQQLAEDNSKKFERPGSNPTL
jgi:hypothetical protein